MKKVVMFVLVSVALICGVINHGIAQAIEASYSINNNPEYIQGGWFCGEDSLVLHEHSTGPINHWIWTVNDYNTLEVIEIIADYTTANYQSQVVAHFNHENADYIVELWAIHEDSINGPYCASVAGCVFIRFAELTTSGDTQLDPVTLSADLSAQSSTGPGAFRWTRNGCQISSQYDVTHSDLTVSLPGTYTVSYETDFCSATQTIIVSDADPIIAAYTIGDDPTVNPTGNIWLCNEDTLIFHNLSTGPYNHSVAILQDYQYNGIDTIESFSYQSDFIFVVPRDNFRYRIDLSVYHEDSIWGPQGSSINQQFRASFTDNFYVETQTQIEAGDSSVTLAAYSGTGTANFTWYKNEVSFPWLLQEMNVDYSEITVYDTGIYIIDYSPFGCLVRDTISVIYGPPAGYMFSASFRVGSDTGVIIGSFCNADSVPVYDLSLGNNIFWLLTRQDIDGNLIDTLKVMDLSNYQNPFYIQCGQFNGTFRLEWKVIDYWENNGTQNYGVSFRHADISLDSHEIEIQPGEEATIIASTNSGAGNFTWWINGTFAGSTSDVTYMVLNTPDTGTVVFRYHNSGNCFAYDTARISLLDPTTGIGNINNGEKRIGTYPNPATSQFTVNYPKAQVEILTSSGQIIYSRQNGGQPLLVDSSNWTPDFYFVRITENNGHVETIKLVRQ